MKGALSRAIRLTFACFVVVGFDGCSDGDGNSPTPGRGTPLCNQWQDAYCAWTLKCQSSVAFCEQAKAVYCKDDAEATRCAMAFSAASCTNPPTDCDLEDLADRAPAEKACNDFRIAVCQRDEQCQAGTYDSCLAALTTALNCTKALGVMPRYEQCLVEIPKAPCASSNLPAACKDVLLF